MKFLFSVFLIILLLGHTTFSQKPESLVNNGIKKYLAKDYNGAVKDFTEALKVSPKLSAAYYNRALAKTELKDLKGAI
ncbi:MAG: hypothetical protein WCZ17_01260, partial [Candidatus Kapaibacterium sp.]